jgi:CDP-diacylglycerol--glycerol-3-phosphate 3-phosphatidyltransferase
MEDGPMWNLPNALSLFRIGMVPVLLGLAIAGHAKLFLAGLALTLTSDIADGYAARKLDQCTALGTRLDSWGDLLTYAVLLPSAALLWPDPVRAEWTWIALALAAFALPTSYGFLKFGQLTSYHTWGAKTSALLIGPGVLLLLGLGEPILFRIATGVLTLAALEEITITTHLDSLRANVPSFLHLRAGRSFVASEASRC